MTTTITVKAGHGWPVDLTVIHPETGAAGATTRVPANTTQDFYVHSGQDLLVHEVQPAEIEAEKKSAEASEDGDA